MKHPIAPLTLAFGLALALPGAAWAQAASDAAAAARHWPLRPLPPLRPRRRRRRHQDRHRRHRLDADLHPAGDPDDHPGLALFYGGLGYAKHAERAGAGVRHLRAGQRAVGAITASLAFSGEGNFFGLDKLFLKGVTPETFGALTTIPEYVFLAFQGTFAAITVALIVGAFAERARFSAVLLFAVLWFTFSYVPMAHIVWGGGLCW